MPISRNAVVGTLWLAGIGAAIVALTGHVRTAPQVREVTVRGDHHAFSPPQIEVQKDEIVKVTFTAVDMPHSFTIDGYRISKRANAGQSVTFEFRADRSGPFPFYCNLSQDDRCKQMRGQLTVK
jgi:heme/copper-type cytochrome/quinol oxidase subunit 2